MDKIIRVSPRILFEERVHTQPLGGSRVKIAGTIIVQASLFVKLFGVEQVWRVPVAIPLFHEDLSERNVHHILGDAPVHIGDYRSAAKVVGMIIEDAWF